MLTRNLFYQLLVLFIFISAGVIRSQQIPADDREETVVDSIDNSENLLDSNTAYKKQFDSLSKEGDWVKVKKSDFLRDISEETGEDLWEDYPFGEEIMYIWRPFCANQYWNPYINGRWEFTCYGWSWISYYNWGWGPYNYGRWHFSNYYGWIWIPGRCWASNWVTWRCHNNYIGWYPTCPVVHWTDYTHVVHTNKKFAFKPKNWQFVTKTNFTKKIDNTTLVSAGNNADILKSATKLTTSVYADPSMPKIKYNGPDVNEISKEAGVKIEPKNIEINNSNGNQKTVEKKVSENIKKGRVESNNSGVNKNSTKENIGNGTEPVEKNTSTKSGTKKVNIGKKNNRKYNDDSKRNDGSKNKGSKEGSADKQTEEVPESNDSEKTNVESMDDDSGSNKTGR